MDDDGESVKLGFGTLPVGVSEGATKEAVVSITDDDGAGVTVAPTSLSVGEGGSDTYTVVLASQPTHDVVVTVNDPADNTDVSAEPGQFDVHDAELERGADGDGNGGRGRGVRR